MTITCLVKKDSATIVPKDFETVEEARAFVMTGCMTIEGAFDELGAPVELFPTPPAPVEEVKGKTAKGKAINMPKKKIPAEFMLKKSHAGRSR